MLSPCIFKCFLFSFSCISGTNKKAQVHKNGDNLEKRTSTRTTTTYRKCSQVSFLSGVFTDSEMAWCGYGWSIVGMEERKGCFGTY